MDKKEYYQCKCGRVVEKKDMRHIILQERFFFWKLPIDNERCKWCCEILNKFTKEEMASLLETFQIEQFRQYFKEIYHSLPAISEKDMAIHVINHLSLLLKKIKLSSHKLK